jgi:hypothetical protein
MTVAPGKSIESNASDNAENVCPNSPQEEDEDVLSDQGLETDEPEELIQVAVGDFVAFQYEAEIFPGRVTKICKNAVEINSMAKNGHHWRWPKQLDQMKYRREAVVQKISKSIWVKRGAYKVPELEGRWN